MRSLSGWRTSSALRSVAPSALRFALSAKTVSGSSWLSRCAPMRRPGSMLTSGDVVDLDLGLPQGREAGFRHPVVVVSAQRILSAGPSVVYVVPLTSTVRGFH
ncbi:MAG: type II toxin-antitoxin system PemK/MazF family toxin, partial [Acidimicrobiales bacterium]